MSKKRRNHSAAFKAKVALDAIKGDKTLSELATQYSLHPNQIQQCLPVVMTMQTGKKKLLEGSKDIFGSSEKVRKDTESEIKELHAKIGQLPDGSGERDFLATCPFGKAFGR
ncbi:MAG: transposase [Fidelibacterota bacterium]